MLGSLRSPHRSSSRLLDTLSLVQRELNPRLTVAGMLLTMHDNRTRLAQDVDEAACQADGVPILRRSSGGGTVLLGRGCLLYSLVLSYDRSPALAEVVEHKINLVIIAQRHEGR